MTPSRITIGDQHNISHVQNVMPATLRVKQNCLQSRPENMTPAITGWQRIPQDKASSRARRITASKMGRVSRVDTPDMLEHRHSEWRCYSLGRGAQARRIGVLFSLRTLKNDSTLFSDFLYLVAVGGVRAGQYKEDVEATAKTHDS